MSTRNIAATVIMVLTLGASVANAQRNNTAVKVAQERLKSTVAIANTTPGKFEVWGAGTIIDSRGYVLTCNHVTEEMKQISVGFTDGQFLPATIVFADKKADVALLKVDGKRDFPEVELSPADLQPGEPMIIIGSPSGLTFSVSAGIVSKIADYPFNGVIYKDAIQTDGTINPGNSGGPVFNGDGEFVGMAFLKALQRDGIAWANNGDQIELVLARNASASKIAGVEHGLALEERMIPGATGAGRRGVFVRFAPDSNKALQAGDRIVRVRTKSRSGAPVTFTVGNRFDFERSMWDCNPHDTVTLTVLRNGQRIPVTLTLTGSGVDRDGE
jgi:serine protease Do